MLPGTSILSVFLTGGLVFTVTPGPAVFYIVDFTMKNGVRVGAISVAVIATDAQRYQVLECVLPDVLRGKSAVIIETKCRTAGILVGKDLQGQRHSG